MAARWAWWVAYSLCTPRAWVRITGEAWMFPCVCPVRGVNGGLPIGPFDAPTQMAIKISNPPGPIE